MDVTRTGIMSPVDDWHFEMSAKVLDLIKSLPDTAKPESDAYMP